MRWAAYAAAESEEESLLGVAPSNPSGIYTETQYCLRQGAALALLQVGQHGATARCGNTGIVTRGRGTG